MKQNPWLIVLSLVGLFLCLVIVAVGATLFTAFRDSDPQLSSNSSVLVMDVKGIISDARQFVKTLRKYSEDKSVKAVVVRVDSPGGLVGPSQEIYNELVRVRTQLKKPVVASFANLAASGGYYVASAADRIVTLPGTITGSIGVIMEFANLGELYKWAKVERYVIKSGAFKDSGSEYRPMSPEERQILTNMIESVHAQFKKAVMDGRKLKPEVIERYADGRIFSGEQAVEYGFADVLGGFHDAVELAGELAGLKEKPEIFYPPTPKKKFWHMLMKGDEDEDEVMYERVAKRILGLNFLGQPLYLMPGYY